MGDRKKRAIIIGAGPAGLTAAYELLQRTDIQPIILERSTYMGGISRTVRYKGNRIDIGGHRFFSKSDRVMNWWLNILPIEKTDGKDTAIGYQNKKRTVKTSDQAPDPNNTDNVMLLRKRKSRIYFTRKFFDYPLKITPATVTKLGFNRMVKIGMSYGYRCVFPIKNEKNLEQFFINRFGTELYQTFFKSYTEKVWGVPCSEISAEWGAQRIKGLSIIKAVTHFAKQLFVSKQDVAQKNTETTLIEQFLYPKFGPGQMWEVVADKIKEQGAEIITECDVDKIFTQDSLVTKVSAIKKDGTRIEFEADYVFSTTSVKELIASFQSSVKKEIKEVSDNLQYRDFLTVGLLVDKLKIEEQGHLIKDNWIYIQESDVQVGRLQIFNNWSPFMVEDKSKIWIGLEYFCYTTDDLWKMKDEDLLALGKEELEKIGILEKKYVTDGTVIRMEKTYPAYFGAYKDFDKVKKFTDIFENLFLLGRNGQHKYNNQDHSMLTAMTAVDNIVVGRKDKANVWSVNTEQEYHEEKSS